MVVGSSQLETLDQGFVLFGTRQQGVPVILRELVLPDGFDPVPPSFTVSPSRGYTGFPDDYLQPPSNLTIVHAMSSLGSDRPPVGLRCIYN
ncbi:unnamed protein product [Schistosoma margrebowiei]|uniref:Uncharacterized protein n=1 Tax=Schistosoma margrebowiei TaxID=48269 RepID=A0A183M1F8_9TREM|nr:unnamed protein product [Schistosoma margrebowiei]